MSIGLRFFKGKLNSTDQSCRVGNISIDLDLDSDLKIYSDSSSDSSSYFGPLTVFNFEPVPDHKHRMFIELNHNEVRFVFKLFYC